MKKIKTLFKRDQFTRKVYDEVEPGCEWVINGEGIPTRKFDGTCCMIKDGILYKRYDVKKNRNVPEGFVPAQDKDDTPGHWPGWIKCNKNNKSDKYHFEAYDRYKYRLDGYGVENFEDGTYELCGKKINGNPEKLKGHILIKHGEYKLNSVPRDFNGIKKYLKSYIDQRIEGIVWYRENGDMVKIKKKDFKEDN